MLTAFIPPAASVDIYLDDHYEPAADGNNMSAVATSDNATRWNNWLSCVSTRNKPIGLAEYAVNCLRNGVTGSAACAVGGPDSASTESTLAADNTYLESQPDGLPVLVWEYWWNSNKLTWQFDPTSAAAGQWKAIETQNGGGAN